MAGKDNMVALRLNNEQAVAVKAWAETHGVSISDVIRAAIEQMTGAKP